MIASTGARSNQAKRDEREGGDSTEHIEGVFRQAKGGLDELLMKNGERQTRRERLANNGDRKSVHKFAQVNVARVVYSRLPSDLIKSQTGRLNKSPHTVHAFANRHR